MMRTLNFGCCFPRQNQRERHSTRGRLREAQIAAVRAGYLSRYGQAEATPLLLLLTNGSKRRACTLLGMTRAIVAHNDGHLLLLELDANAHRTNRVVFVLLVHFIE